MSKPASKTVEKIVPQDLHLRHITKDGKASVSCTRVWSSDRFLKARAADAEKEGGAVGVIDEETYAEERNR